MIQRFIIQKSFRSGLDGNTTSTSEDEHSDILHKTFSIKTNDTWPSFRGTDNGTWPSSTGVDS